ncbi:MAG: thymidylate kinase [Candidatus Moranbacteria bacterium]|nr:thymidylate kinase [Candidatus Moranbacteria bacterium]
MRNKAGKFVIIEGIDGSGKATQTEMLFDRLKKEGRKVKKIDFPRYYDNFFGKLIGECLKGEHGDFLTLDPYVTSVLYACDRFESSGEILKWIKQGYIVLSDRYVSSNFIHQGGKLKGKKERLKYLKWLEKMEYEVFKIPKPDLIIYLDVSLDIARKLAGNKTEKKQYLGGKKDVYEESASHLNNAKKSAEDLVKSGAVQRIDCVKNGKILSKKEIAQMIWEAVGLTEVNSY